MSDFSITLKRLLGMDRGGVIRACLGRFNEFLSVRDAAAHVKATAQPGEVILLKGSNNLHLERIAIAMQSDVKCWEQDCGLLTSCFVCNRYGTTFEQHRALARQGRRKRRWHWLDPFRKHG